jgi:hypothetical protein
MDADDDIIQSMLRAQQAASLPIEPAAAWSAVGPRVARIRRTRMAFRSGLIGLVGAGSVAIGSVAVMVHSRSDGAIRTSESDDMTFEIDDTAPEPRASQTTIELRTDFHTTRGLVDDLDRRRPRWSAGRTGDQTHPPAAAHHGLARRRTDIHLDHGAGDGPGSRSPATDHDVDGR